MNGTLFAELLTAAILILSLAAVVVMIAVDMLDSVRRLRAMRAADRAYRAKYPNA